MVRISPLVGGAVESVGRLFFHFGDSVDLTCGALQLSFSDDRVLFVDTRADWTLHLNDQPWTDPFAGPFSEENSRFVERFGCWRFHDLSDQADYHGLISSRLQSWSFKRNLHNEWMGLDLSFSNGSVIRTTAGSELSVALAIDDAL